MATAQTDKKYSMSLRAKVVLSLTFLMAAAMLLIGTVMVRVSQRDLLRAKVEQGFLLKGALEKLVEKISGEVGGRFDVMRNSPLLAGLQGEASGITGKWQITVTDRDGFVVYRSEISEAGARKRLPRLERAALLGQEKVYFTPEDRFFWWRLPEKVVLDGPLFRKRQVIGGVRLEAPLEDVRSTLWQTHKLYLIFILLDIMVFVAFGTYVFSKMVVRPVRQLVETAESFQEGDTLPDVSAGEQNELGKLSQALNLMLHRLAENKEELRQHIVSLEQANLELKRAQQEVIFSEKLASVGRLAAGIAHEIGNPIGIVLGYLELLQREDLEESERNELLGRMDGEVQRINQIIRQLLDFSRPSATERQAVAVHPLIQETLAVMAHQLRQQEIELSLELKAESDTVFANADQLKQVFLNILVNAADAMAARSDGSQGGQLCVSTRSLPGEGPLQKTDGRLRLRRHTDPQAADYRHLRRTYATVEKQWLEIRFADTGVGIAREDQERIFDPFFTTKGVGSGTGLGLSVSIKIVETLGGRLEMSSRVGEGTAMSVILPLFDEETTTPREQE
jgi:signal transduction histidine kinase